MSAVNPAKDGKQNNKRVTCDRCGKTYRLRSQHVHVNSPECIAEINHRAAMEAGYICYVNNYNAGHCSRAEWAKPFIKQFDTGIGKRGYKSILQSRWWAVKWWLPIAYMTRNMSTTEREKLMTQVLTWWEAGEMEPIDNMVGLIELSKEAL